MENIKKVKYFLICVLAIVFLLLGASFVYAQCGDPGAHCGSPGDNPCCSGLICTYRTCRKPIGASCNTNTDCDGSAGGFMHCQNHACCGWNTFPTSNPDHCCEGLRPSGPAGSQTCKEPPSCDPDTCDQNDTCIGGTYSDYSCVNDECVATNYSCDSRCDSPPTDPILYAPPHNGWINYDPVFRVISTEPDGERYQAYFQVSGYAAGWGDLVDSGEYSSWGALYVGNCNQGVYWRAYSKDTCGFTSAWSSVQYGWWLTKVDKDAPTNSISYTEGTINTLSFAVALTEDDACSGIKQGAVQISINDGAWQDYSSTINDFNYTGQNNACYKFRYQVTDNAGNLSGWKTGNQVCIDVSKPTASITYPNTWINSTDFNIQLTENDPGGSIVSGNVDIKTRSQGGSWPGTWSDYATTIDDFNYAGENCKSYKFRYQVTDNAGNVSDWADPGYVTQIDAEAPITNINYPIGIINTLSFTVALTESDDCSGLKQGNVEVSINDGAWQTYSSTVNDFTYNAQNNTCYRFRYSAQDNADNWSNWAVGEETCIDFSVPTCSINYPNGWINSADFNVELTEDDPGGSIANGDVDIMSKHKDESWLPNWSDHANTIDDFTFTGQNCYFYKFRYQVTDNAGNICPWADPGYVTQIDTDEPTANINYPGGTINQVVFDVNLTESDGCSGIKQGEVQLSTDGGGWEQYSVTVIDFEFTGSFGHSYKFRYQVQDNVDNFSDWVEGPTIYVEALPVGLPGSINWIFCPDVQLELNWDYSDITDLPQIAFHIQIDDNDDFSSPVIDTGEVARPESQHIFSSSETANLLNGTKYYWQIKVQNSANDWSGWSTNSNLIIFFDFLEGYSSY